MKFYKKKFQDQQKPNQIYHKILIFMINQKKKKIKNKFYNNKDLFLKDKKNVIN